MAALVGEDARIVDAHNRAVSGGGARNWNGSLGPVSTPLATFRIGSPGTSCAPCFVTTRRAPSIRTCTATASCSTPHTTVLKKRWKALQNFEMLRARKYVENVYYHELARDLRRFGYDLENHPRGDFEIKGVCPGTLPAVLQAASRKSTRRRGSCWPEAAFGWRERQGHAGRHRPKRAAAEDQRHHGGRKLREVCGRAKSPTRRGKRSLR